VALLRWLEARWPQGWSGGIYNCRPVRGRQSMSIHSEGRAVDFMLPGVSNPAGITIVRALGANGDRNGIQTVIWDRRIWSRRSPNGRAYTGVNPHTDHLHIELNRSAAQSLTVERLGGVPAPVRPTVRRGDRGAHVANAQRLLGVTADGIFGPETEQAVRTFQQSRSLQVDGVVGPRTWAALTS
jgi:peptidoglycan hydrolase-like protein with peptidoglycan-binding domain